MGVVFETRSSTQRLEAAQDAWHNLAGGWDRAHPGALLCLCLGFFHCGFHWHGVAGCLTLEITLWGWHFSVFLAEAAPRQQHASNWGH